MTKGKGGRPKGTSKIDPLKWVKDIEEWCKEGLVDYEIARRLGISMATLYNYKNNHPELKDAMEKAKMDANFKIENSLFKASHGYNVEEIEEIYDETGTLIKTTRKIKHIPINVRAAQYLLNNRDPEKWKDKKEVESSGSLTFNVTLGDEDDEE